VITKSSIKFAKTLDFGASDLLTLYHQTSDKKLLWQNGENGRYLVESEIWSFESSDSRSEKAEVRTVRSEVHQTVDRKTFIPCWFWKAGQKKRPWLFLKSQKWNDFRIVSSFAPSSKGQKGCHQELCSGRQFVWKVERTAEM
jgi:hypothetical protein